MIRPFRETDRDILKAITAEVFRPVSIDASVEDRFGLIAGVDWQQRKLRHIDADCDANPDGIFVAEDDGWVVGYITTRLDEVTRIGWIPNMAVAADCKGRGLGHALLERAMQYLRDAGMVMAKIETLEQNAVSQHLFPKLGFVEVARQIHYVRPL